MDYEKKHKKLRQLVKKVNNERRKQAKQIDLLCNDMIEMHRDFIKKLDTISFRADFYAAILGKQHMDEFLCVAAKTITNEIPTTNVAFFMRQQDNLGLYTCEHSQQVSSSDEPLETYFTPELVRDVCRSNQVCTIDKLLELGLQCSPALLNKISAVTVPLRRNSSSFGFILITSSSQNELTSNALNKIRAVSNGLSVVIESCETSCHSQD